MNKNLESYLTKYNLKIDKNYAYGFIEGYEINLSYKSLDAYPITLAISFFADDEEKNNIYMALAKEIFEFFSFKLTAFGLTFYLNDWTLNSLLKHIDF